MKMAAENSPVERLTEPKNAIKNLAEGAARLVENPLAAIRLRQPIHKKSAGAELLLPIS